MPALWQRQVFVRIDRGNDTAKELRGLRVKCSVKATSSPSPSEATLEIYNASADTTAYLSAGSTVEVWAGYDVPRLLFRGNPVYDGVRAEWKGPDRVVRAELADGGDIWTEGRVSLSYSTATSFETILKAAFDQTGIPTARVVFPAGSTPGAYSFGGTVRDLFSDLAKRTGNQWFLRDGAVCLFAAGGDTGEDALLISSRTGNLVGTPTKKDTGIECKALVAPLLRPGMPFVLESRELNGTYTVKEIAYSLDSFGGDFYMTIKGE